MKKGPSSVKQWSVRGGKGDDVPLRLFEPPTGPRGQDYGMQRFCVINPWGHQLVFPQETFGLKIETMSAMTDTS